MNQDTRNQIFDIFQNDNPEPTTELNYDSAFQLLIAVILSAQATDISVNIATNKLFKVAPDVITMLDLGEQKIKKYINNIGLFNSKAKYVIQTCRILHEQHSNEVPENRQALEALPGVGRKTANVVLNTFFDHDTIAVDTHILRISNRIGLAKGKTPDAIEKQLMKKIAKPYLKNAHHWLILHGRYVCTARKPKCTDCKINHLCEFKEKSL